MNQGDAKSARTDSMSDAGSSSRRQGMLAVNDLTYLLEPDLSVAVNVTHKNHYFQSSSYTNTQRGVCILNSGADYIDTRDSYLQFSVCLNEANAAGYFGTSGSAVNLIKTITISTRSGDEISRIVDCNRLNHMINAYRFDKEWANTVGRSMGLGGSVVNTTNKDETTFCIPLYLLSDFFGYGRLLPSMIMSGLRIEIEFEDPSIAFVHYNPITAAGADAHAQFDQSATALANITIAAAGGPAPTAAEYDAAMTKIKNALTVVSTPVAGATAPAKDPRYNEFRVLHNTSASQTASSPTTITTYTIEKPKMVLKSVQLTDATQRALNELSATNGLEIVYTDYERTEQNFASSSTMQVEVRKACSRALQAYARVRVTKTGDLGMRYEKHLDDGPDSTYWQKYGGPAVAATADKATSDVYTPARFDSFASEPLSQVSSYQWQLGSLYFPQQPLKDKNAVAVAKEGYMHSLMALNKFGPNRPRPAVPLANFSDVNDQAIGYAGANGGHDVGTHITSKRIILERVTKARKNAHQLYEPCVPQGEPGSFLSYGQTWIVGLERSSMFELAGVPINNSRVLSLRMEHDERGAKVDRTLDVYLKYVKLARVFLNNVEVEQ